MLNVVELKPSLLTLTEASNKYDVSYQYLYKWCVLEKELRLYFKRGKRAVSESDLLRFMDERVKKWRA